MTSAEQLVTGVDFIRLPTRDLERGLEAAVAFYGTTLGLPCRCTGRSGTSPSSRPAT
jgi:hypothetical protein